MNMWHINQYYTIASNCNLYSDVRQPFLERVHHIVNVNDMNMSDKLIYMYVSYNSTMSGVYVFYVKYMYSILTCICILDETLLNYLI